MFLHFLLDAPHKLFSSLIFSLFIFCSHPFFFSSYFFSFSFSFCSFVSLSFFFSLSSFSSYLFLPVFCYFSIPLLFIFLVAIPILFDYFLLSFRRIFKKKKAFLQPPPSMPSYFSFYFASHIFLISNLTYLSSRSLDFFSFLIVLLSYLFFSFFLLVLFLFLLIFYPSSFSYSFLISVH